MGFYLQPFLLEKNGLLENMIFDWMLFLELNFKDNSDHKYFKQIPLQYLFTESIFFSKSGIFNRSYRGSLKQNLHSVVHQYSVVPLPVDFTGLSNFSFQFWTNETCVSFSLKKFDFLRNPFARHSCHICFGDNCSRCKWNVAESGSESLLKINQ